MIEIRAAPAHECDKIAPQVSVAEIWPPARSAQSERGHPIRVCGRPARKPHQK